MGTGITPHDWYSFHFGSKLANAPGFNPSALLGAAHPDCYVMFADFCSFSSFFQATDKIELIEALMTSFYSQVRKAIHRHDGMLDKILGDAVLAVWGLHQGGPQLVPAVLAAAKELVAITNAVAEEWQSHIDLLVAPKGLRIGLSKGAIMVFRRDLSYPGLSILGNPINLASRLQVAAKANQLVCSNQVYKDLQALGFSTPFQPYQDANADPFVSAKNFGPVKAWVLDLAPPAPG